MRLPWTEILRVVVPPSRLQPQATMHHSRTLVSERICTGLRHAVAALRELNHTVSANAVGVSRTFSYFFVSPKATHDLLVAVT